MKLLNIQKEIPDILLDIRYCTTYNFIGEIIDGYIDPVALGTKELVKQLKVINSKARQMGYRLKIWDAYRPQSALDHFMTWKDTEDVKMKSIFYPKYSKKYRLKVKKMNKDEMEYQKWVYCPVCGNKTRVRLRKDTVLLHFPLFCPKCKKESLIDAEGFTVRLIGCKSM